ncbi:MAG: hypothetical protein E7623_04220 [Ruminococcaceae bacterium]|nr:hypothetical protein [Oscillospiraceae bacterium]
MKKSLSLVALLMAILMFLPVLTTAAVSFTEEADALNTLGLFKGTDNGYELDKAPTRAQAAVMLVRLLGKEGPARLLKWTAPFKDVPDWAKSYVQYLYNNGLTSGTGSNTYSPDNECNAQMFATFLLRALGYSDAKGDFSYAEAISFAKSKGIINGTNYSSNGKFLRDHMVGMSFMALMLPTADGKYSQLIYKLVDDGAVTKAKADSFVASNVIAGSIGSNVSDTYLKRYSDYDAAIKWTEDNITKPNYPPVKFKVGSTSSDNISWKKNVGNKVTVIDYPNDEPVQRTYYTVSYTSESHGLKVELTVTEYSNYPVVEYSAYIINTSKGTNKNVISTVNSVNAPISSSSASTLHAFRGADYLVTEYDPIDTKLGKGTKKKSFSVTNGKGTSTYLPNFNLEDTANNKGVIAVLSWEGNWKSDFTSSNNGITWAAGQYNTNFKLLENESYKVPMVVLMFYNGDMYNGQNIWRSWFYKHNVLRAQGERMDLNLLVCVGVSDMGAYNAAEDIATVAALKNAGMNTYIRTFAQDAGWYKFTGSWDKTGNWYPDPTRYPQGLRPVTDAVHAAGMKYTLWLEPERAMPGTKTFDDLKDSIICLDASGRYVSHNAARRDVSVMVNFGEDKALNYMIDLLDNIVTEYNIDAYRQDCNFCQESMYKNSNNFFMSDYWAAYDSYTSSSLHINRTGMTENRYCAGIITFWDELVKRHPHLVIDCCASGGQRYTLESARYSFMHSRTDWISYTPDPNYSPITNAQCDSYVLSLWYQLVGSGANPSNKYDIRSRIITSLGIGATPTSAAHTFTPIKNYYSEMKNSVPYIVRGHYYPLTDYSKLETKNQILQYVDPTDGSSLIYFYFRNGSKETVKPRDIDANATYEYYDIESPKRKTTISGKELISKGLPITGTTRSARVIKLEIK